MIMLEDADKQLIEDVAALALACCREGELDGEEIQSALFAGQPQPPTPLRTIAVAVGACATLDRGSQVRLFRWLARELMRAETPLSDVKPS